MDGHRLMDHDHHDHHHKILSHTFFFSISFCSVLLFAYGWARHVVRYQTSQPIRMENKKLTYWAVATNKTGIGRRKRSLVSFLERLILPVLWTKWTSRLTRRWTTEDSKYLFLMQFYRKCWRTVHLTGLRFFHNTFSAMLRQASQEKPVNSNNGNYYTLSYLINKLVWTLASHWPGTDSIKGKFHVIISEPLKLNLWLIIRVG